MFYDERIEKEKGRITKNALLISAIIFAVFGILQAVSVALHTTGGLLFSLAATEILISALCFVCLIIGAVKGRADGKDERASSEKANFYDRIALPLIMAAGVIYSIFLAVTSCVKLPNDFFYMPSYDSIKTVIFVVGVYIICEFRRNDIFFNYSIMENEHYYRCVFKNICRFFLYIICLIAISTVSFLTIYMLDMYNAVPTKLILQAAGSFLTTFVVLSIMYLIYSFLEKTSCENEMFLSHSSIFSLAVTIILYVMFTQIIIAIDILPISQALKLQMSSVFSVVKIYLQFALIMFMAYFNYEYKKVKNNDILSVACAMIISSEIFLFITSSIMSRIQYIALPYIMNINDHNVLTIGNMMAFISYCYLIIEYSASLFKLVGFGTFALAMVNDKMIHSANILAMPLFLAIFGVKIFLRTQIGVLGVNIYGFITETLILIYFFIIIAVTKSKIKKLHDEGLPC